MAEELTPVLYNKALLAISELHKIDEVKEWINRAAAYVEYAKQAKDETLEKQAKEIRVRAQIRAGELFLVMERGKPGFKAKSMPDMAATPNSNTTTNSTQPVAGNSPFLEAVKESKTSLRTVQKWEGREREEELLLLIEMLQA